MTSFSIASLQPQAAAAAIGGETSASTSTTDAAANEAHDADASSDSSADAAGDSFHSRPLLNILANAAWEWWSHALQDAGRSDGDSSSDSASSNDGDGDANDQLRRLRQRRRRQRRRARERSRLEERTDEEIPDWERRYWEPPQFEGDARDDSQHQEQSHSQQQQLPQHAHYCNNNAPPKAATSFSMVKASHFDSYSHQGGNKGGNEGVDGNNGEGDIIPTLHHDNVVVLPGSELQQQMAEVVKSQMHEERRRNRRKTKINASANNDNDTDASKEKLGSGDAASLKEDAVNDGASDYDDDEEEDECVICMEPFHSTLNPQMPTACGCGDNKTYFHLPCLLTWVERDVTCPGCRERLIWQEFG